jgi:ribose transport system ATP-binding protein
MRDGQTVAERGMRGFDKLQLVATMLGRELAALQAVRRDGRDTAQPEVLRLEHLRSGLRVRDASMSVRRGEILGMAGLLGSGRTEVARAVFGADAIEAGQLHLKGEPVRFAQPGQAIASGVGFLPEDRKTEGIIPDMSIRENLTLMLLPRLARLGIVDRAKQLEIAQKFIDRLGIRCSGPEQPIRELSGGNQQKVLLARSLASHIDLLLLDEPTRGIDVGAKAEILTLIRELTEQGGLSVLLIASELEELVNASDRIAVLRDGTTVAELEGADVSEDRVMAAMAEGAQLGAG